MRRTTRDIPVVAKGRKKRGPNKRIDPRLKGKLDTFDLHMRYDLGLPQIRKLADGDDPVIQMDRGENGRLAATWEEIFRVEGWLQEGRVLTQGERRQAMANPLTPEQYATHPRRHGPQTTADVVRKAIREGRQTGAFRLGSRVYLRAAAVLKLGV
jgi:hypothetical protein